MAAQLSPIRVVGRYALYNEIAAGGMATIHLGRLLGPVGFARTVAVKRLHPQYAKDPEFVSMFLDEARLAARVQHPNVVATIDVVATDGELFLIMDYVRGESLSKLLRACRHSGERVPPRIAAAIMCGFLHGLHAAHEAKNERGEPLGLVHRDVSPQNVLVGADGIARVLDFGIAKAAGRIQVTRDGQIKGKLAYMPPEQLAGRELTRAVDIYASAVVMWETLTGERLFKGETEGETLAKILRDPIPAPSDCVPSLPRGFDAPLLKALSRDVHQRHATAKELARELEKVCGIASPTEVGEWVEKVVGHVLSAREKQIAELESSSASLNLLQSHRTPEVESDSDMSAPSAHVLRAAMSPVDTLPMGSGPPITPPHGQRHGMPTPATVTSPVRLPPPPEEQTSSGSRLTGTALVLPTDRKLPIFASIAGLLVLAVVVAVIIGGKFSGSADAAMAGKTPAPAASSASLMLAAPSVPAPNHSKREIPDPPEPSPAETASPTSDEAEEPKAVAEQPKPANETKPATLPAQVGGGHAKPAGGHATPKAGTKSSTSPPPTGPQRKNCDPPYTIDAQGRRKYKLECM
jgi:serine/threonine-protein kinase